MRNKKIGLVILLLSITFVQAGCVTSANGKTGNIVYEVLEPEPDWIRNGEPIEFEGELWYPLDTVDILRDDEVIPLGMYRDITFYLQKVDIRPFDRIYTKFGKNKFRAFETRKQDDRSQRAF